MSIFDTPLADIAAPTAVLDRTQVERNLDILREAADGVPLRIATKSIRVRGLVEWAMSQEGVHGALGYSLAEAWWLFEQGARDLLVAYPSVDVATMRRIAADAAAREAITLMVDVPAHVELIAGVAREVGSGALRVAIDVDASLRIGRVSIGAHRSAVHDVAQARAMGELIARTDGVVLVGAMMYEAQIAGVPDATAAHRLLKRRSFAEMLPRRKAVIDALRAYGDLDVVNGGGSGSAHLSGRDGVLTDIAVGSGLFTSTLFDGYDDLTTKPAAYFVSPVVRKPSPDVVATFSGGYVASGSASKSRVPKPVFPEGLSYFGQEGAGEVQTPLHGKGARDLQIGDVVWFRHAKAGEMCERFNDVVVVEHGAVTGTLPTYRGEGQNFG